MLCKLLLSSLLALAPALSYAATNTAGPGQCVTFDASWNLLAFNYDGKDLNAGADLGATAAAVDITAANRPPFDVASSAPLCFLSQFENAIYVLNADAADASSVYIFDVTAKAWSKQATSGGPASYDPAEFGVILDRDTNVFYALSKGTLTSLNMDLLSTATSETLAWNLVQDPQLAAEGTTEAYEPVLALASNHIHFLGVPGLADGTDRIFVIHYSWLQPEIQSYGSFPTAHGKAASLFRDDSVQLEYAFIPDDGSATYMINVRSNTTVQLPGPPTKDPYAMYAASPNALVQLASDGGAVQWIGYDQAAREGTAWQPLASLPAVSGARTVAPGGTNGTAAGNGNGTRNGTSSAADDAEAAAGGAAGRRMAPAAVVASLAVGVAGVLALVL